MYPIKMFRLPISLIRPWIVIGDVNIAMKVLIKMYIRRDQPLGMMILLAVSGVGAVSLHWKGASGNIEDWQQMLHLHLRI